MWRAEKIIRERSIENIFFRLGQIIIQFQVMVGIVERSSYTFQITVTISIRKAESLILIHKTVIIVAIAHIVVETKFRQLMISFYIHIVITETGCYGIGQIESSRYTRFPALHDIIDDGFHICIGISHIRVIYVFHPQHFVRT